MMRPLLVAVLSMALLACGCASRPALLPPGEDPNQLVESIAQKGRGEAPVEPDPTGSFLLADCLKTGAKVSETCLLVCGVLVFLAAQIAARGSSASAGMPDANAVGESWRRIWSEN
jgi:hypothetical protein